MTRLGDSISRQTWADCPWGGRLSRQSMKAAPAQAGGQHWTPGAGRCEPGPGQAMSCPTNPPPRQKAGRNPALPVRCQTKPSVGRMLRGLGRWCAAGMLLLRAFPTGAGAGCTLPSKPLSIPGSGGRADSSTPQKEAALGPRTQNKFLRPTASLKQKGKQGSKIEKKPTRACKVTEPNFLLT